MTCNWTPSNVTCFISILGLFSLLCGCFSCVSTLYVVQVVNTRPVWTVGAVWVLISSGHRATVMPVVCKVTLWCIDLCLGGEALPRRWLNVCNGATTRVATYRSHIILCLPSICCHNQSINVCFLKSAITLNSCCLRCGDLCNQMRQINLQT